MVLAQFSRYKSLWDIQLFKEYREDPNFPKWLTDRGMQISVKTFRVNVHLDEVLRDWAGEVQGNPNASSSYAATVEAEAGTDGLLMSW